MADQSTTPPSAPQASSLDDILDSLQKQAGGSSSTPSTPPTPAVSTPSIPAEPEPLPQSMEPPVESPIAAPEIEEEIAQTLPSAPPIEPEPEAPPAPVTQENPSINDTPSEPAAPGTIPATASTAGSGNKAVIIGAIAVLLIGALGAGLYFMQYSQDTQSRATATPVAYQTTQPSAAPNNEETLSTVALQQTPYATWNTINKLSIAGVVENQPSSSDQQIVLRVSQRSGGNDLVFITTFAKGASEVTTLYRGSTTETKMRISDVVTKIQKGDFVIVNVDVTADKFTQILAEVESKYSAAVSPITKVEIK